MESNSGTATMYPINDIYPRIAGAALTNWPQRCRGLASHARRRRRRRNGGATYGIQSGKRVTHRLQKGWSTYLATTEWSSPLYLYRFSVSTPCAPMNPIPARSGSRAGGRRRGRSEVEGAPVAWN